MIKMYMVFINCGFSGIKYFHDKNNALQFAESVNEKVEIEYCSAREYFSLQFEDLSPLQENINVQFNIVA